MAKKNRVFWILFSVCILFPHVCSAIKIDISGNVTGFYGLSDEESRFFPGTYFFRKGCEASIRGDIGDAIALWELAASWGHKGAQYNLGIVFLKGEGTNPDIPKGVAWLALAAERHDERFQSSFDAAWYQVSIEDRILAKKEYMLLKPVYGDDFALKRALRRYDQERRNLTGSRVGASGHLTIYSGGSSVGKDVGTYLTELEQKANEYFNDNSGTVSVGDLVPIKDEDPAKP